MSSVRGNRSEIAYQNSLIVEKVRGRMIAQRIPVPTMARRLGMSVTTFHRRMDDPATFTLQELRKLVGEMGWSAEDRSKILFG